MAYIVLNGQNIYFEKTGNKGKPVILLHGWGQNTQMMDFIAKFLSKHFVVYNIDFPGFGNSEEPKSVWGCEEYTDIIRSFCIAKKIENPIFIAHSFGCRIAVRYAYKYQTNKMVLTGAAGLRDKRTLSWYVKTYSYKIAKKLLPNGIKNKFINKVGSSDYKNTSGIMRGTFVKVVNDDVKDLLPSINTETLLVFGENDDQTPTKKGKLMEKLMPNAALVVFENDDHFAYINEAQRFNAVLDAFLRSEY